MLIVIFKNAIHGFNNANIQFKAKKLIWRSYTAASTLLIVRQIELIDEYKFVKVAQNKNSTIFIIYVGTPQVFKPVILVIFS